MPRPLIEIRNLFQSFRSASGQESEVLHDINLDLHEHEIVAILGPSGCGKSSLLRAILGLEPVTSGQILYRATPQLGLNPSASLVFQNFALYTWTPVQEKNALRVYHATAPAEDRGRQPASCTGAWCSLRAAAALRLHTACADPHGLATHDLFPAWRNLDGQLSKRSGN